MSDSVKDSEPEHVALSTISRRRLIGGTVGLAALGLTAAVCGPLGATTSSGQPKSTKWLQVIISNGPDNLDPHLSSSGQALTFYNAIFDSLTKFDQNLKPVPGLATEWKLLNDTTWRFTLRKGVKFHNGEDFDATSVKFSLERNLDPKLKSAAISRMPLLAGVDIVDQYTVDVRTSKPAPIIPLNVIWGFIMPAKYAQEVGNEKFAQAPIGTGPFILDKFVPGQQGDLHANPTYWRGAPKIDKLTLKIIIDPAVAASALKAGEAQIAPVPVQLANNITGTKGLKIQQQPKVSVAGTQLYSRVPSGPLTDKRVRQALNYALDKQTMVTQLLGGYARVAEGQMLTPECFGYNPDVKAYPYDVAKAKQLLADAGYAKGFELPITVNWGLTPGDKDVTLAMADQLAKVGVTATISNVENSVFFAVQKGIGDKTPSTFTNFLNYGDARFCLQHGATSSQFPYYSSPQYDALWAQSESTMDPTARAKVLQQLVALAREEANSIFLYQVVDLYGIADSLKSWQPHPTGWMFFDTAELA